MAEKRPKENNDRYYAAANFLNAAKTELVELADYELAAEVRDLEAKVAALVARKLAMPPQWTEVQQGTV